MFAGIKLLGLLLFVGGITLGFGDIIRRRRNPDAKRNPWIVIGALLLEVAGLTLLLDGCGRTFFR